MSELPNFDELWDYDHPDETEKKFRQLLPQAGASGDMGYQAELLTQIARTQSLQRKFEEAHDILNQVEGMLEESMPRARIRYLLERGRTFNSSGQKDKARPLFLQAWELGREVGEDFHAVDAAHMMAIVEDSKGAMEWNLKAVELAESSVEARAHNWLGSLYNNIGWTYHDMGDYETALDTFEKALKFREEQGKEEPIRIAKWCIARTLRSLGRVEEALEMQQAQLKEYEELGEEPGYTYEELGENLLLLGREEEAKPYFAQAYKVLSQDAWLMENEAARIERLKELGGVGEN